MRAQHCAPGIVFVLLQIWAVLMKIDHPLSLTSLHTALHILKRFCPIVHSANASANVTQNKFDIKLQQEVVKKQHVMFFLLISICVYKTAVQWLHFCMLCLVRLQLVCMPNAITRVVVSVSTSRSRDVSTSRLGLVSRKTVNVSVSGGRRLGLVSVSAIYDSCPRPIFGQIVQPTVRSLNRL